MRAGGAVLMAGLLVVGGSLHAQPSGGAEPRRAEAQCPRDAAPIPPELAAWKTRQPLALVREAPGPLVTVGRAYDLSLLPDARLRLPNLPGPVSDRVGHGGVASFSISKAGTYRVALGSGVWVDVVRDGKALESVRHGHGPACSGIAKMIDFDLAPGRYVLTLDGSETAHTALLIAALP